MKKIICIILTLLALAALVACSGAGKENGASAPGNSEKESANTVSEDGETYTKRTVAVPGFSEHHTGLALDLYLNIDGEDVYYNEDMIEYPEVWE